MAKLPYSLTTAALLSVDVEMEKLTDGQVDYYEFVPAGTLVYVARKTTAGYLIRKPNSPLEKVVSRDALAYVSRSPGMTRRFWRGR